MSNLHWPALPRCHALHAIRYPVRSKRLPGYLRPGDSMFRFHKSFTRHAIALF